MKNIFKLLAIAVCLTACDNNDEQDWTPDTLSMTVTNAEIQPTQVGDGNWGAYMAPEFEGVLNVNIQTDKAWQASVSYITDDEEEWITLSEPEGNGSATLQVNVAANKTVKYRKAYLTIRTMGNVPVDKKLTVIQTDSDPILEFEPEEGMGDYDATAKILTVDYLENAYTINFWSNIRNYSMKVVSDVESQKVVDWVKNFSVKDGVVSFNTTHNLTGDVREAVILFKSGDGFTETYTLKQGKSLYRNILQSVDGVTNENEYADKEYSINAREVTLSFDTNVALAAELVDATSGAQVNWGTVTVDNSTVKVSMELNSTAAARQAVLSVKAADNSMSTQPAVTWSFTQREEYLSTTWAFVYDGKMIFGPNARTEENSTVIATYESTDDKVTVTKSEDMSWGTITMKNGKVYLNIDEYSDATSSRTATLSVKNADGKQENTITIEQRCDEAISDKNGWTIEPGNDYTLGYGTTQKEDKIIDDIVNTHWQWNWASSYASVSQFPSIPYEFVVDFGSEQLINAVKVWQTPNAVNGFVKDIQFKVSNDKSTWTNCGQFNIASSNAEVTAEIATGDKSHLILFKDVYSARYVRIMLLSNLYGIESAVNNSKNAYLAEFNAYLR